MKERKEKAVYKESVLGFLSYENRFITRPNKSRPSKTQELAVVYLWILKNIKKF